MHQDGHEPVSGLAEHNQIAYLSGGGSCVSHGRCAGGGSCVSHSRCAGADNPRSCHADRSVLGLSMTNRDRYTLASHAQPAFRGAAIMERSLNHCVLLHHQSLSVQPTAATDPPSSRDTLRTARNQAITHVNHTLDRPSVRCEPHITSSGTTRVCLRRHSRRRPCPSCSPPHLNRHERCS